MAGVRLLLKYQWRAYWRGVVRAGGQGQFYLLVLAPVAYLIFIRLPPLLRQAADGLAAGKTENINLLLLVFATVWLFSPLEDLNISLTAQNLLRFPLFIRSLLAVRILSIFISPIAMLITIGSLMTCLPFLKSLNPPLGIVSAIIFYAAAVIVSLCLSHFLSVARWRRRLLVIVAVIIIPFGASLLASGNQAKQRLVSMMPFTPVHLVTTAAGANLKWALFSTLLLLALAASAGWLLLWSFRLSMSAQQANKNAERKRSNFISFPGRLGGLVRKEQRYFRKLISPWFGFLIAFACSLALLKNAIPPVVFQVAILLIFATNADVMINCFGLDRSPELNRYLILPLKGRAVVRAKNLGIAVIIAAQLSPMLLLAWWRFGWLVAILGLIEALALALAHLAFGNSISVGNPWKMQFYGLSNRGNPLVALASFTFGSLPGVAILYLAKSDSGNLLIKLILILLLTGVIYVIALHFAGKKFERSWQAISDRLS